jgi:beta-glucanase (GH16 family)
MKNSVYVFVYSVLCSVTLAQASPYPLGNMSCEDIGAFASQAMQWREDGVHYKEAKTRLDGLKPDESVEKKNMRMLIQLVYGSYGDNWTVESAGTTMKMDCESGR